MAITYEWQFSQFDTAPTLDGLTNVVEIVHWRYIAVDDTDGLSAQAYGTANLGIPGPSEFVPFEDITKEMTIQWVSGVIDVPSLETNLATQIATQRNPPIVPMSPPFGE